ncbi:MAG: DUF1592 domain-containing protein [Verrucomicrobiota bacterium]
MNLNATTPIALLLASALLAKASNDLPYPEGIADFFDKNCYDCHDDVSQKGGLNLLDLPFTATNPKAFRKWVAAYDHAKSGVMPPENKKRPDAEELQEFLAALEKQLTEEDEAHKEVVFRRLNRSEYSNALQDLLGVTLDLEDRLPDDRVPRSFDTQGAALTISDSQMEQYFHVAREAIGQFLDQTTPIEKLDVRKPARQLVQSQMIDVHNVLLGLGDTGLVSFSSGKPRTYFQNVKIEHPGTYRIRVSGSAYQSEEPVVMMIPTKKGERYFKMPPEGRTVEVFDFLYPGEMIEPQPFGTINNAGAEMKKVNKGIEDYTGPGLFLGDVEIEGPLEERPSPAYKTLMAGIDRANSGLAEAKTVIERLLPLAYRRPVSAEDKVIPFRGMEDLANEGRSFEDVLRWGVTYILCSPEFLYLHEPTIGEEDRLTDHAFAARLSHFLWSRMPDETLSDLATSGELRKPDVLRTEVERLLSHPNATAFILNFGNQWLRLDEYDVTQPDEKIYPEYDKWLRTSMIDESRHFLATMLKENLPVTDLIDSDWLILNSRLAEHYDIEGVSGDAYERVSIKPDHPRGGLMTQGSILKLTSNGINTSPVPRGLWVLETLLGIHLPPPPEAVPAVEPDITGAKSLREELVLHRSASECSRCHQIIDPPGFALENFDPVGGWRTEYRPLSAQAARKPRIPVDATGTLTDGAEFDGINQFKSKLLERSDQVYHGVAEAILTYGTGRKMSFSDRPELKRLTHEALESNYGFRDLVHAVIQSQIFNAP